jgi:hypothetical protein
MSLDYGSIINQLEARIARLESDIVVPTTGTADVGYNADTDTTTVDDHLDWTAANGWEPYSTVSPIVPVANADPDDDEPDFTGGDLSTPYGRPEAHLIGSMCVLTGMVRRKAGASAIVAGTRYNLPMFGLPVNWRPTTNVILPCLVGNADPSPTGTIGTVGLGWIEIRSDLAPLQPSGRAYLIGTTVGLSPTTGWVALQGIFLMTIIDASDETSAEDTWDDAHFQTTWDSIGSGVTWNNYTSAS